MTDHERLDAWLDRFAAGAGSQFVWCLWAGVRLRAWAGMERLCPITAEYAMEYSEIIPIWDVHSVLTLMGADHPICDYLITSADNDRRSPWYDQDIRARLLRICSLQEVSP